MDKTASRSRTRRTLRLLLRGSGWYFFICILSGTLLTVCDLVIPQVIRVTVDSVIGNAPPALGGGALRVLDLMGGVEGLRAHMWRIAVFLGALGLLGAMFRYLSGVTNAMAGETLVKTARDALYHHIQRLPWAWHSRNPTGDIIQRCTSDVERVKTFFQEQFVITFRLVVTILLALACMLTMNAKLSLVALVMLPIVIAYSLHFYNRIRDEFTECDENEGILSTIAQENLTGVRVVKAFGRENFERERFEKQNVYYTGLWVGLLRDMSVFWSVGDLTSCLQIMLVVVFGTVLCVRGEMTGGEFISFAVYNAMLIGPVRRLGRLISEMSKMGVSLNRLGEVLSAEPEQDVPDAVTAPMDRDIHFENVSFRYSEDQPEVLRGVSFTIPAGKSFGILGGTGSGKSTLLALLCRLYAPTEGEILVGDTPLARMRAKWVRENVGVVLQEPFLFSRSVEENIGVCGADAEAVRAAAVTACIDGDISRFANGYETVVGERGVTLS
ncbi:MAG: ATP-binding cassette domain-containing protein, partial [Clostridia bacterium]|nr:ATP-binding cassette domain-containing protein [Clostridia bacterium]